ncbi:MAG: lipase maturation factor family protein [Verrucomicrobiales bacterium]|nr:lipase maturation factor family protein [Verrucomicrobiales bacterium]
MSAFLDRLRQRLWPASRYRIARWIVPRGLAVIYLIAFLSWWVQKDGLCGGDGILPTSRLMENIHAFETRENISLLSHYPSIFWFGYSDALATALCAAGVLLALLVLAGIWQGPLLLLLWAGYLSIVSTADVFMGYQWDALLLEAGFLSLFLAPWRWRSRATLRDTSDPPRFAVWLLQFLLFRLMILSGWVKWAGGDAVWRDMTALRYHFATQPLPNGLSAWMNALPPSLLDAGCWGMYAVELLLPWGLFFGRWSRAVAAAGCIGLMSLIFVTGNYNFFNLLTIVLAFTFLDDTQWPQALRRRLVDQAPPPRAIWRTVMGWTTAACLTALSLVAADSFLAARTPGWQRLTSPTWAQKCLSPIQGFRSINAYGLFQDMTEERPEIVLEVSDDGILWLPLEFRWKPGDPDRSPGWVAPHQPRLDWQMWFAALYPSFDPQPDMQPQSPLFWFGQFLAALLNHREDVWSQMEEPPFPRNEIRHIRARLYRYTLNTPTEARTSGRVWSRQFIRPFSPTFSVTPHVN